MSMTQRSKPTVENKTFDWHRSYTGKSGFVWPFNKPKVAVQITMKGRSGNSLSAGASKIRMVGRGGSGSKLRQLSLSSSGVSEPDDHCPQTPEPEPESSVFYRPGGRGGLGSLSTRPPRPLKPPVAFRSLLHGRKQSLAQLYERYRSRETSRATRPQSLLFDKNSNRNRSDLFARSSFSGEYSDDPFSSSTMEGPSSSISHGQDPELNQDIDPYIEDICPNCHEHRVRNFDKLSRTLGVHPSSLQASKRPAKSNNSPSLSISTSPSIGSESLHFKRDSITTTDDLDLADNLFQPSDDLDNRSSFDIDIHSPITFSPPSLFGVEHTPHPEPMPTSLSDVDSLILPMIVEQGNPPRSHSSQESSSLPSATHIYVSNQSTTHFDKTARNGYLLPDSKTECKWLVPLEVHRDEFVVTPRTGPPKPQSWIGEWNDDLKDVITSLRRL